MNHRHKKIVIHIGQGIFLIMINLLIFMGGQCIKNVRNNWNAWIILRIYFFLFKFKQMFNDKDKIEFRIYGSINLANYSSL